MILFENARGRSIISGISEEEWNVRPHTHIAQIFAIETSKRFFSTTHSGWHECAFRGNALIGGVYKGKFISEYRIEEIENTLRSWGVKYLVLHTDISKDYFAKYPDRFGRIWKDSIYVILEHLSSSPEELKTSGFGRGWIERESYFTKVIKLTNMTKGEEIIARFNYFPAWKAYCGNQELDLRNKDGQVMFLSPESGDYKVVFYFAKYKLFSALLLISLFTAFVRSFFERNT